MLHLGRVGWALGCGIAFLQRLIQAGRPTVRVCCCILLVATLVSATFLVARAKNSGGNSSGGGGGGGGGGASPSQAASGPAAPTQPVISGFRTFYIVADGSEADFNTYATELVADHLSAAFNKTSPVTPRLFYVASPGWTQDSLTNACSKDRNAAGGLVIKYTSFFTEGNWVLYTSETEHVTPSFVFVSCFKEVATQVSPTINVHTQKSPAQFTIPIAPAVGLTSLFTYPGGSAAFQTNKYGVLILLTAIGGLSGNWGVYNPGHEALSVAGSVADYSIDLMSTVCGVAPQPPPATDKKKPAFLYTNSVAPGLQVLSYLLSDETIHFKQLSPDPWSSSAPDTSGQASGPGSVPAKDAGTIAGAAAGAAAPADAAKVSAAAGAAAAAALQPTPDKVAPSPVPFPLASLCNAVGQLDSMSALHVMTAIKDARDLAAYDLKLGPPDDPAPSKRYDELAAAANAVLTDLIDIRQTLTLKDHDVKTGPPFTWPTDTSALVAAAKAFDDAVKPYKDPQSALLIANTADVFASIDKQTTLTSMIDQLRATNGPQTIVTARQLCYAAWFDSARLARPGLLEHQTISCDNYAKDE